MERISQQTIDDIINAADIVDVIGEFVQLQPAGKSYKGLCPFHNEKTPSFFVNKEKHLFNCFGCGEKGNAAGFLMKYKNLTYIEALKSLADRYHVPLEINLTKPGTEKYTRLYEINQTALEYYQLALTHMQSGKPAMDYLINRGLDVHTIQYFEIGFAPNDMDVLYKNLKTKYQELDLLELGLIKKNTEGNYYDLFRNRIIFPIKNAYGKVVGFSGRIYQKSENEPKYVNSPFTSIFTKGEILYNLDRAQPAIKQMKRVVLYEGFMDVIASVNAGIKEAVASMGTSLTPEQAKLIKKYTDNVLLCYDGDSAGFEAMMKAIHILESEKLVVSLIVLPEELDPDEYIKKYSPEHYRTFIDQNQIDKYEFRYRYLLKHSDLTKAGGIERFKLSVFDFLRETSATVTELYLKRFASDAVIDFASVRTDYRDYQLSKAIQKSNSDTKVKVADVVIYKKKYIDAENILMNYYLYSEAYRTLINAEFGSKLCEDNLNKMIKIEIEDLLETGSTSDLRSEVIKRFKYDSLVQQRVEKVLTHNLEYSNEELDACIKQIKSRTLENDIKVIRDKQQLIDRNLNKQAYTELDNEIVKILQRKENLWKNKKS